MSSAVGECHYAQQLVQTYFRMLTVGCGRRAGQGNSSRRPSEAVPSEERCSNAYCQSNASNSNDSMSPADAAILSVYLATQAPTPLCMPIVSYFSLSQQEDGKTKDHKEANKDRPETDDGDDDQEEHATRDSIFQPLGSTPRRRLSSAMELDLTINNLKTSTSSSHLGPRDPIKEQENEEAEHRDHEMTSSSLSDRKLSLPKQKLLEALKKSFPGIARDRMLGVDLDNRKAGR